MQTTGIICEYNPMHSGHAYQIERVRAAGADAVVLVMSGSFTQRGYPAFFGKYDRAEIALAVGADLVLELPYPYCASGAEYFATAGVRILEALSVDTLCFGSESGDADLLRKAAEIALSDAFRAEFAEAGRSGVGSAAAYFNLLSAHMGVSDFGSNDVLGVEYVKALLKLGCRMSPLVIRRNGSAYHTDTVEAHLHPSATALRKAIEDSADRSPEALHALYTRLSGLSDAASAPFLRALGGGTAPAGFENGLGAILSFYRMHEPQDLSDVAEMHGGLAERICHAAHNATDVEEFFTLAATKKYTDSRVRRAVLYGMTGVTESDLKSPPAYVNLLGASERGRAILSAYRKRAEKPIEIVTRPAAILSPDRSAAFRREAELQRRSEALYTLFLPRTAPSGIYLTSRAVMKTGD